jgi:hypothetical protein
MFAYYCCIAYIRKCDDVIDTCKALDVSKFASDWSLTHAESVSETDIEREYQIEILVGMAGGEDDEIVRALGHEEV